MNNIGPIMLIAGTAIGSGMLALPIILAKLGLIQSICLMIGTSILTYYSALINLELHLQSSAKETLSLAKLAKHFSGSISEFIASCAMKTLSVALMAVFIYAGSSVTAKLIFHLTNFEFGLSFVAFFYSLFAILILMCPIKLTDYINRILFMGLLFATAIIIGGIAITINWSDIPGSSLHIEVLLFSSALPIVFTSFGFQGSIPTIVEYCGKNNARLKKVFFWGSMLPVIIYLCWTIVVLLVIYQNSPEFYIKMTSENIEVSSLIEELSKVAKWKSVKMICWWISFFSIITSVIGVGIGLTSALKQQLQGMMSERSGRVIYPMLAVVPAYWIAVKVPNAFIVILGFAGMLLSCIAILLPLYLLTKVYISGRKFYYPELKNGFIPLIVLFFGIGIVIAELMNFV